MNKKKLKKLIDWDCNNFLLVYRAERWINLSCHQNSIKFHSNELLIPIIICLVVSSLFPNYTNDLNLNSITLRIINACLMDLSSGERLFVLCLSVSVSQLTIVLHLPTATHCPHNFIQLTTADWGFNFALPQPPSPPPLPSLDDCLSLATCKTKFNSILCRKFLLFN